jgi:hypothetical protein
LQLKKMNALTFSGVFLLLFFSLSSADICTDFTDTNSDLYRCNVELIQRSNSACEGNCRSVLEQYADDCLNATGGRAAAQAFKDSLDSVCPSTSPTNPATGPTSNNSACTAITDADSELFRCNVDLASTSQSACEGNCRSVLEQYADDCLPNGAQAFKDSITAVCGGGGGSSAAEIGSTTLLTTVSALLFAVYTAFM